jgi:hypothetical protein
VDLVLGRLRDPCRANELHAHRAVCRGCQGYYDGLVAASVRLAERDERRAPVIALADAATAEMGARRRRGGAALLGRPVPVRVFRAASGHGSDERETYDSEVRLFPLEQQEAGVAAEWHLLLHYARPTAGGAGWSLALEVESGPAAAADAGEEMRRFDGQRAELRLRDSAAKDERDFSTVLRWQDGRLCSELQAVEVRDPRAIDEVEMSVVPREEG